MPSRDRLVVTGSSGMIGTGLVESLLEDGYRVTGVDEEPNPWSDAVDAATTRCDLRSADLEVSLPDDADLVVHLAAHSRVTTSIDDPRRAIANLETTLAAAEYADAVGADLLFTSSREVYGDAGAAPTDESGVTVDGCQNPYGASKVGGEALLRACENCYGVDVGVLRLANVYGPYDPSDRVIPLFIARADRGKPLTVYGEEKLLDFVYLADCVAGIRAAVDQFEKVAGEAFNVGSGRGRSLLEVGRLIADVVPGSVPVEVGSTRTGEVDRFVADVTKAGRVLGYEPEHSFRGGIERTVEWYLDHEAVLDALVD